jgi:enoyl-CoA hydratase/carnithine racemase
MTQIRRYQHIAVELKDSIATICLDRPEVLNAMTRRMRDEFIDAIDWTDNDDDVRVVIVTGRGRGFCSGADLSEGSARFDKGERRDADIPRDGGGVLTLRLYRSRKPLIAAVNGAAVGLGATMTLPMDVRLMARDARYGFVFARRGIVPDGCSSWFLPRLVGVSRAAEWLYSGRLVGSDEAQASGLVRDVHESGELLSAARRLATDFVHDVSAVSVSLSRQLLWRSLASSHPMDAHRSESLGLYLRGRSPDAYEGVNAFRENRSPQFADRASVDAGDLFGSPEPNWNDSTNQLTSSFLQRESER